MAQPAVIPVKTGQKVPSVFGQWKAVITVYALYNGKEIFKDKYTQVKNKNSISIGSFNL